MHEAQDQLPEGRRRIAALAAQVPRDFKPVSSVRFTGHADRLGTVARNDALSVSRAHAVRALFVQSGVSEGVMQVGGEGSRHSLVACPDNMASAALVACLQPNRRVEIEIAGEP